MARDLPSDEARNDDVVVDGDELMDERPRRLTARLPSYDDPHGTRSARTEWNARSSYGSVPPIPPPLPLPPPPSPPSWAARGKPKARAESAPARSVHEQEIREGDILAEKYSVVRKLGRAGAGEVALVRHVELGQHFLFKYLPPEACSYPDTVARFLRGARSALQLMSEHAARTIDAGRLSSGVPYVVTEYLDGSTLRDLLRMQGGLLISDAVDLVLQAAVAVAESHRHGVVHGSLSPSTLFVAEAPDGSSFVKVMDFGVALRADSLHGAEILHPTGDTERAVEALSCTAPEQIRRAGDVDARTDVWALGAILYESLTGFPVYHTDNVAGMLAMIAADPPPVLTSHLPDAPGALERVILRCLEKERRARYASVAELAVALRSFASLEGEGLVDQITRTLGRANRPLNSRALVRVGPVTPAEPAHPAPVSEAMFQRYQVIAGAALIAGGLFGGTILAALLLRDSLVRAVQPPVLASSVLEAAPARAQPAPEDVAPLAASAPLPKSPPALPTAAATPPRAAPPKTLPPAPEPPKFQPVSPAFASPERPALTRKDPPSDPGDRWGIAGNASKATPSMKTASVKSDTGGLSLFDDVR